MNGTENKKANKPSWVFVLFIIGVFAEVLLTVLAKTDGFDKTNMIITLVFFSVILIIFVFARRFFKTLRKIENALVLGKNKIVNFEGSSEQILAQLAEDYKKKDVLFHENSLDRAFESYLLGNERLASVSSAKANIEDYLIFGDIEKQIGIFFLNQVSGAMTGLGILGTFVGLSVGLNSFDLIGSANAIEERIQPLMEGIKVAFHTSICGLIYSLGFNFMYRKELKELQCCFDEFICAFEEKVATKLENGSTDTFIKYLDRMCDLLDEQNNRQKEQMDTQQRLIVGALSDSIVPEIKGLGMIITQFAEKTQTDQTESLKIVVDNFVAEMRKSLGSSFIELSDIIKETNKWQRTSLDEMKEVNEKVSGVVVDIVKITDTIQDAINSVSSYMGEVKELQKAVRVDLELITHQTDINNKSVEQQTAVSERMSEAIGQIDMMSKTFISQSEKQIDFVKEIYEKLFEEMNSGMTGFVEGIRQQTEKYNCKLEQMAEECIKNANEFANNSVAEIGCLVKENAKCISDSYDEVNKKMTASVNSVQMALDSSVEEIGKHLEKNLTEQYTLLKNNAEYIVVAYSQMDIQFKKYIEDVKENSKKFADEVRNVLHGKLDIFDHEVGTVFEGINQKLNDIGGISNDISVDISDAASKLSKAAGEISSNMDIRITDTFTLFDRELSAISSHLSGTIKGMDTTLDSVPLAIRDVLDEMNGVLNETTREMNQYLEYARKLHHNVEIKWNQLAIEENKGNS